MREKTEAVASELNAWLDDLRSALADYEMIAKELPSERSSRSVELAKAVLEKLLVYSKVL